jgi:hypothetical protein
VPSAARISSRPDVAAPLAANRRAIQRDGVGRANHPDQDDGDQPHVAGLGREAVRVGASTAASSTSSTQQQQMGGRMSGFPAARPAPPPPPGSPPRHATVTPGVPTGSHGGDAGRLAAHAPPRAPRRTLVDRIIGLPPHVVLALVFLLPALEASTLLGVIFRERSGCSSAEPWRTWATSPWPR